LIWLVFHLRRYRGCLEETGLPLVKPFLCFGSAPYLFNKIRYYEWYTEKHRELGRTFARYQGPTPNIVTIDPEMIKEITVKQFDNFTDILDIDFSPGQTTLDVSRGDTWRALRKMMTPTFTTGRLKQMMVPIEKLADSSIDHITEKAKENPEIDFKPIVQSFAVDVICKVAFGMETKCRLDQDQEMFKLFTRIINDFRIDTWIMTFLWNFFFLFPELIAKAGFWPESATKTREMTKDIMGERVKQNIKIEDFVDRLIEYKKVAQHPITEEMIEAQGMIFLLAGFETTANTLGSMVYQLAEHQDVQERIYEEILDNIGSDDITHENIGKLEYLEACIMEDLRLCGPATEHDRVCVKECVVKGIKIKKGVQIQMPITASHMDPEFFPEPEKFKPERFLKENADNIVPFTWRPFGAGNRVCIGQRFAMMEMKIFLAKFLAKFKLTLTEKSGLEAQKGTFAFFNYPTSFAKIEARN